ncbi:MAG: glycosyltransferase [Saprospiraceae bacterium]|nr:glycosyltransferase [Saprospiraceae bacterium]MDW8484342.1 glycosyltransferase [Saprospiraceae bacterium]
MHQSFISVVGIIHTSRDIEHLTAWLANGYAELAAHFSDFEFILVNNHSNRRAIDAAIEPLPQALRQQVFLLNLSAPVSRDNAILAGLDRANGDYAVIFEFTFADSPQLIRLLWEKAQEGFDIVYLRAPRRQLPIPYRLMYGAFYGIFHRYSKLRLDPYAHHSRIISRRALNSLLRLRENSHYLKALYALVGYNTAAIDVAKPLEPDPSTTFAEQFKNALVAITSFTSFLSTLLGWIFLLSCIIAAAAIANAIKVRLTNVDFLGQYHKTVPGWAYLVVLVSVFFAVTCLNLYLISVYLANIYREIKNRPLYIVESVKRY